MNDLPTRRDVARLAGVSEGVVSYVINNVDKVRPETRARVIAAMNELHYRPNWAARALRAQATRQIAVLARDIENPFYASLAAVFEEVLAERGYGLMLFVCRHHSRRSLESILNRQVDGVISASVGIAPDQAAALREANIPVVEITRGTGMESVTLVDIDWAQAMEDIFTHLVSLGHERVGFISGQSLESPHNERYQGFEREVKRYGLTVPPDAVAVGEYTFAGGLQGMERLLAAASRPTAVICGNDLMAAGAAAASHTAGVRVPDDLSLVGFDDILMGGLLSPPLTTVAYPIVEAGRKAAELLLRRLEGETETVDLVRLPHRLVVRESTSRPEGR